MGKLWHCPPYKDTDSLNGARALSMFWVVLGHTFLMSQGVVGHQHPQDIQRTPLNDAAAETNWAFMFVLNAQMSVDTFFYMAGFLFSLLGVTAKSCVGGFKGSLRTRTRRMCSLVGCLPRRPRSAFRRMPGPEVRPGGAK